ncbi:YebG family protein [Saccharophagus degradans]|uniref:YebG family protein n=1 Tax=Saccharophagus degradans TaxID=86304 RepID=A0AAW7X379_9GAMM|nr:YebG family protein [Saccharophagus degradans]MDO6422250.1 YebG family protein [Saccharophagus degradans]MDO6607475.1 YebG family protein [Saccharophagus degradans]WGO97900.1 YebG family protein [Saccharophagus degradans]
MAVIAVWKCDRDGSMFEDKKLADAHDKMLELAESITRLIEANVPGVSEADVETIGLLLAKRSDDLIKACKGKPEVLLANLDGDADDESASNVTSLAG